MVNMAGVVVFAAGALLVSLASGAALSWTTLATGSGAAAVGDTFTTTATVSLAAADELNGFDVTLTYNAAVAVPTGITLNGAWNIPLDAATIGSGTIHVAASRLGFCSGTCPLFTVAWSDAAGGAFSLSSGTPTLTGRQSGVPGNLGQVATTAGSITITGGQQPTATNTPVTPTNSPVPPTNTRSAPTSPPLPSATSTQVSEPPGPTTPTVTATAMTTPIPPAPANTPASPPATASPGEGGPDDPGANGAGPAPVVLRSPTVQLPALPAVEPGATAPSINNPVPTAQVSYAPQPAPAAPRPINQVIPLPPRAGDTGGIATPSPLKQLGLILMLGSGFVLAFGLFKRNPNPSQFSSQVNSYLDDVESSSREK